MKMTTRRVLAALGLAIATTLVPAGSADAVWSGTATCNGTYVKTVRWDGAYHVNPTSVGRQAARYATASAWAEATRCMSPVPLSQSVINSLYTQFQCHAHMSAGAFGYYSGGAEWDLETYRPATTNWWTWVRNKCNW
jgi:hypothetical protein